MRASTKARRLMEHCEDEYIEVDLIYQKLKMTICPDEHTRANELKHKAMHALVMVKDALDTAEKALASLSENL